MPRGRATRRRATATGAALALAALAGCSPTTPDPPPVQEYVAEVLAWADEGLYADSEEYVRLRAEVLEDAAGYDERADAYDGLRRVVTAAGGPHSRFLPPEEAAAHLEAGARQARTSRVQVSEPVPGDVGLARVPGIATHDPQDRAAYATEGATAIVGTPARCGWVVDLRYNEGGTAGPMIGALGPLVADGEIGHQVRRDGTRTDTVTFSDGVVRDAEGSVLVEVPPAARRAATARVAVVHGPGTASAAELVVGAFRGQPGARSFGAPTAGLASGNTGTTFDDGSMIAITASVLVARDGTNTDGGPFPPDEPVDGPPRLAVDRAVQWLLDSCDEPFGSD